MKKNQLVAACIALIVNIPPVLAYSHETNLNNFVELDTKSGNGFISYSSTMTVPMDAPPANETAYIWPGLVPWGEHFDPIGDGVLQPVLTHGPSSAPHQSDLPPGYQGWWISGQYVNTKGKYAGFMGSLGGDVLAVKSGDKITTTMKYNSTTKVWTETITDLANQGSVSYSINLSDTAGEPQEQNRAVLYFEPVNGATLPNPTIFSNIDIQTKGNYGIDCNVKSSPQVNQFCSQCQGITQVRSNEIHIDQCAVRSS